ncbi:MAG: TIR domain-containing protein [Cytophagaceae bacterium]|nr:TIR domain-containing protein [Cytophagaceae bacterium]
MKIFISHITEESSIAIVIKNWIESTFLGNVEVFVSSSNTSIQLGSKWLEQIDKAIEESSVFIVLCSEKSVLRPWINFESGCAWIKKVPLIPICHTGISKSELPAPLSFFQAVNITQENFSELLFEFLATQLNIVKLPRIAYEEMKSEINNALLNINYDKVEKSTQIKSDKLVVQSNKENIKTIYNPLGGKTVIVASDGTGDYFSIQHAIDELGVYDQIYIKAGIYEEEYIQLNGKRDFRILGESKERDSINLW